MNPAKFGVFALLVAFFTVSVTMDGAAQYYVKKKKKPEKNVEQPQVIPPQVPQTESQIQFGECTARDQKALKKMDKGLKAIEKDPLDDGDAEEMLDFLKNPKNIDKLIRLYMRCQYAPAIKNP